MACEQTSSAASDHGRQEDSRRIDVMFLCDEWKSSKGRLSTFNREFPVNLAETTRDNINVHCYVAQSDEQSKEDDVIVLYTWRVDKLYIETKNTELCWLLHISPIYCSFYSVGN